MTHQKFRLLPLDSMFVCAECYRVTCFYFGPPWPPPVVSSGYLDLWPGLRGLLCHKETPETFYQVRNF